MLAHQFNRFISLGGNALDTPLMRAHAFQVLPFTKKGPWTTTRSAAWEAWIIVTGLRLLTILTVLAFVGWAVVHLVKMFK